MYPEYVLPADQKKAWLDGPHLRDRRARRRPTRFGWKVGDRVPIQATIWRKKDGASTWEFNICGIYDGDKKGVDTTPFFFNYDYFDEARQFGQGQVGWYVIRINDPAKAPEIAKRIDAMFANSSAETKTTTEKAFAAGVRQADRRHRRDHPRASSRRCSSRSCSWPPTRWRSRCASARASSPCSRRSASPTASC